MQSTDATCGQRAKLLSRDNLDENAHCFARIVPEVLTIASSELLPALGREGWHATGEHGDEG